MDTTFNRFESAALFSLQYLARTCLWRKAWTVCEPQRSSECCLSKMVWCWHQTAKIQKKPHSSKKATSNSGKEERETYISTFLMNSWLIIKPKWRFGVTWVRAATQVMNRLQKCVVACNAILFVSQLIQTCFRQKFLHIFQDVWSLHLCFCADLFRPLGWITRNPWIPENICMFGTFFLRHPVY